VGCARVYGMIGTPTGVAVTVAAEVITATKVADMQGAVLIHYVAVSR
jgi:hypothetical protein